MIALGRNAGFTLEEIATMFTADGLKIDRGLLLDKADQLDRTIRQLNAMSKGLRHAAQCPEQNHFECTKFQRLLSVALNSQRRKKSNQYA